MDQDRVIGGTDAKRIAEGEWNKLWLEKTGRVEPEDLSRVLRVMLGKWTEPFNRTWYEQETGRKVEVVGAQIAHPAFPYMTASVDGLVEDGFETGVWEAKHTGQDNTPDKLLATYRPQCQHYLACTGRDFVDLSVLFGNRAWMALRVVPDQAYIAELLAAENEFWGYIVRDEEPADRRPMGAPPVAAAINRKPYDMTRTKAANAWTQHAGVWLAHRESAQAHAAAAKEIKELVPEDASMAFGAGITVTVAKNGALTVKESKHDERGKGRGAAIAAE
jgi:predicted phage-related endonuclease